MLQQIVLSVAQGSNDAFAQSSGSTGLSNVINTSYRVLGIEVYFAALPGVDSNIQVAITRKSFAAFPAFTERALIRSWWRFAEFTTSGLAVSDQILHYNVPRELDLRIVEETLYIQIDSNATSASNGAAVRLLVEEARITEVERLSIQSYTLS